MFYNKIAISKAYILVCAVDAQKPRWNATILSNLTKSEFIQAIWSSWSSYRAIDYTLLVYIRRLSVIICIEMSFTVDCFLTDIVCTTHNLNGDKKSKKHPKIGQNLEGKTVKFLKTYLNLNSILSVLQVILQRIHCFVCFRYYILGT